MSMEQEFQQQFNNGDLFTCEDVATMFDCTHSQARYYLNRLVKSNLADVSRQTVIDERGWHPETKSVNFYWKKSFGQPQYFPVNL